MTFKTNVVINLQVMAYSSRLPIKFKYFACFLLLNTIGILDSSAQTEAKEEIKPVQIDPSKPSNLYTQINANFEWQHSKSIDLYGVRANLQYAFNPDNLLLFEAPFLYNTNGASMGLGDMRVRYFNVVKRNISPKLIAVAPFLDISMPTGSFEKGFGSSNWSLGAGVVVGLIVSPQLALFPGVSFVHITKPTTNLIPDALKTSSNGFGLQFNASYSFNQSTFLFINPTPSFLNTKGSWTTYWSGELNFNKVVTPNKLKLNAYWGPNFTTNLHVYRIGATVYL